MLLLVSFVLNSRRTARLEPSLEELGDKLAQTEMALDDANKSLDELYGLKKRGNLNVPRGKVALEDIVYQDDDGVEHNLKETISDIYEQLDKVEHEQHQSYENILKDQQDLVGAISQLKTLLSERLQGASSDNHSYVDDSATHGSSANYSVSDDDSIDLNTAFKDPNATKESANNEFVKTANNIAQLVSNTDFTAVDPNAPTTIGEHMANAQANKSNQNNQRQGHAAAAQTTQNRRGEANSNRNRAGRDPMNPLGMGNFGVDPSERTHALGTAHGVPTPGSAGSGKYTESAIESSQQAQSVPLTDKQHDADNGGALNSPSPQDQNSAVSHPLENQHDRKKLIDRAASVARKRNHAADNSGWTVIETDVHAPSEKNDVQQAKAQANDAKAPAPSSSVSKTNESQAPGAAADFSATLAHASEKGLNSFDSLKPKSSDDDIGEVSLPPSPLDNLPINAPVGLAALNSISMVGASALERLAALESEVSAINDDNAHQEGSAEQTNDSNLSKVKTTKSVLTPEEDAALEALDEEHLEALDAEQKPYNVQSNDFTDSGSNGSMDGTYDADERSANGDKELSIDYDAEKSLENIDGLKVVVNQDMSDEQAEQNHEQALQGELSAANSSYQDSKQEDQSKVVDMIYDADYVRKYRDDKPQGIDIDTLEKAHTYIEAGVSLEEIAARTGLSEEELSLIYEVDENGKVVDTSERFKQEAQARAQAHQEESLDDVDAETSHDDDQSSSDAASDALSSLDDDEDDEATSLANMVAKAKKERAKKSKSKKDEDSVSAEDDTKSASLKSKASTKKTTKKRKSSKSSTQIEDHNPSSALDNEERREIESMMKENNPASALDSDERLEIESMMKDNDPYAHLEDDESAQADVHDVIDDHGELDGHDSESILDSDDNDEVDAASDDLDSSNDEEEEIHEEEALTKALSNAKRKQLRKDKRSSRKRSKQEAIKESAVIDDEDDERDEAEALAQTIAQSAAGASEAPVVADDIDDDEIVDDEAIELAKAVQEAQDPEKKAALESLEADGDEFEQNLEAIDRLADSIIEENRHKDELKRSKRKSTKKSTKDSIHEEAASNAAISAVGDMSVDEVAAHAYAATEAANHLDDETDYADDDYQANLNHALNGGLVEDEVQEQEDEDPLNILGDFKRKQISNAQDAEQVSNSIAQAVSADGLDENNEYLHDLEADIDRALEGDDVSVSLHTQRNAQKAMSAGAANASAEANAKAVQAAKAAREAKKAQAEAIAHASVLASDDQVASNAAAAAAAAAAVHRSKRKALAEKSKSRIGAVGSVTSMDSTASVSAIGLDDSAPARAARAQARANQASGRGLNAMLSPEQGGNDMNIIGTGTMPQVAPNVMADPAPRKAPLSIGAINSGIQFSSATAKNPGMADMINNAPMALGSIDDPYGAMQGVGALAPDEDPNDILKQVVAGGLNSVSTLSQEQLDTLNNLQGNAAKPSGQKHYANYQARNAYGIKR